MENVKDTYHASLLHAFFGTFRITRLTQGGGVVVSDDGAHHASYTIDRADDRSSAAYREQGIRSERQDYKLADPSLLESVNEFGDDIRLQILTVFPTFVLQQIQNCLAVRQVVPKGPGAMELHWTYVGFEDDTPEMHRRRLKQLNLVGPAGYVSMEDGCVGGFVQRGAAAAGDEVSIVNMGGEGAESDDTRATEASVRGFWTIAITWTAEVAPADPSALHLQPQVAQLNADYARAIDDDRLEDWPEFFAEECLYTITSADNHRQGLPAGLMWADSKGMLRDRVAALREANIYERQSYRHVIGQPAILGEGEGGVRAETPFLVVRIMRDGKMDLFATGRYLDAVVEETGALRFRERIVVCDSSRVDTLLAIPL